MDQHVPRPSKSRPRLFVLAIMALTIYVLLPQVGGFRHSASLLQNLSPLPLVGAFLCMAATFFIASASYHLLSRKTLLFRRTVLVSIANMFTNRLLPAGAGSIATFYLYLRRRRHTVTQATGVIAMNNLLGFVAHGALILMLIVLEPKYLRGLALPRLSPLTVIIALVMSTIILSYIIGRKSLHKQVPRFLRRLQRDLQFYMHSPPRLVGAFLTSLVLTLLNSAVLWGCSLAVHASISPIAAFAVFTIGMLTSTATPTPGGLGGAEVGLLAGLVAYHVASSQALATVILYRLLTYWLTIVTGAITYAYVEKRGYLHAPVKSTAVSG